MHTGIYAPSDCSSSNLDHGVLATGYGVDKFGREFYWIKNSWGASFGFDGYMKLPRNKNNFCGVATEASFPHIA